MKKENLVSVPFMVLGIVFCTCLVAANLLETKVVQLGPISGIPQGASDHLDGIPDELHGSSHGADCCSFAGSSVLGRGRRF